jgi:hypothetical protein
MQGGEDGDFLHPMFGRQRAQFGGDDVRCPI